LKTRLLIEALLGSQGYLHYFPIDISETILLESSQSLLEDYEDLYITAHVAEYNEGIHRIAAEEFEQKMVIFLGSNIGNFDKDAALQFLRTIRHELNADDHLLLGVDMQKDPAILEAAYDDAQGVTAEFNLNLLRRINRELNGDFDLEAYSHLAVYNPHESRMEMHLRSEKAQQAFIGRLERSFGFEQGETIHTENSHKYSPDQLARICRQSGFRVVQRWQDDREYFSLVLLAPV